MEIKVTNFSLIDHFVQPNTEARMEFIYPALQAFKKLNVPVFVASSIVKSIKAVEEAIKECDGIRIAIIEPLCKKDDKDKPIIEAGKYKFSTDGYVEFNKKWNELLDTEVSLEIFPVNEKDLDGLREINITCYETLTRHGFIKEETKPSLNGKANKKELIATN